ncbi:MAG TPA: hypothetical protein PL137_00730, partial [Nocardioides sp.]|nr:hypothetical protein [Nocardioides sp.]
MKGRIPPAEFVRRFNPLRAAVGHEPLGETTFVSGHRPGQPTHLQGRVRAPGRTNTHALLEAAPTVVDQTRLVESDQRRVAVIPRVEVTREDLEDVAAWMSELRRRGQVFERGRRIEGLLRSTGPSGTAPSGAGGCGSRGGGGVGSTG